MIVNHVLHTSVHHCPVIHIGKQISDAITIRWIQRFILKNCIVQCSPTGKLMVSPEKQADIEKETTHHFEWLNRAFESEELKEDDLKNADETHFVRNMDDGVTLGLMGENNVKYANVVSDGEAIKMMVRTTEGRRKDTQPPFQIFKSSLRSHPIRELPDIIPGVSYRSFLKDWMNSRVWCQRLTTRRAKPVHSGWNKQTLFVENCSSHIENNEGDRHLHAICTLVQKISPNAKDYVQPVDHFVIQTVK